MTGPGVCPVVLCAVSCGFFRTEQPRAAAGARANLTFQGVRLDLKGKGAWPTLPTRPLGLPLGWAVRASGRRDSDDRCVCVCSQILESSQTLLSVLKKEAGNLSKATVSEQKGTGGKDS